MRIVLAAFMAALVAGCSCTAIDCGSELRFRTEEFVDLMTDYEFPSVTVCVGTACSTVRGEPRQGLDFSTFGLEPGTYEVEVTLLDGVTQQARYTGSVTLDAFRPNGAFCDPTCGAAVARLVPNAPDGEQVANE